MGELGVVAAVVADAAQAEGVFEARGRVPRAAVRLALVQLVLVGLPLHDVRVLHAAVAHSAVPRLVVSREPGLVLVEHRLRVSVRGQEVFGLFGVMQALDAGGVGRLRPPIVAEKLLLR